jgi:hypothetical protein
VKVGIIVGQLEFLKYLYQVFVQFAFEFDNNVHVVETVVATEIELVLVGVQIVPERKVSDFEKLCTTVYAIIGRVAIAARVLAFQCAIVAAVEQEDLELIEILVELALALFALRVASVLETKEIVRYEKQGNGYRVLVLVVDVLCRCLAGRHIQVVFVVDEKVLLHFENDFDFRQIFTCSDI